MSDKLIIYADPSNKIVIAEIDLLGEGNASNLESNAKLNGRSVQLLNSSLLAKNFFSDKINNI